MRFSAPWKISLIRVATKVQELGIPLIGINLGNLGYLCELEQGTAKKAIDHLMADEYIVEERMTISEIVPKE